MCEQQHNQVPESVDAFAELEKIQAEGAEILEQSKKETLALVAAEISYSSEQSIEVSSEMLELFCGLCRYLELDITQFSTAEITNALGKHMRGIKKDLAKFYIQPLWKRIKYFRKTLLELFGESFREWDIYHSLNKKLEVNTPEFNDVQGKGYSEAHIFFNSSVRIESIDNENSEITLIVKDPLDSSEEGPMLRYTYHMFSQSSETKLPFSKIYKLNTSIYNSEYQLHDPNARLAGNRPLLLHTECFDFDENQGGYKIKSFNLIDKEYSKYKKVSFELATAPNTGSTFMIVKSSNENRHRGYLEYNHSGQYFEYYIPKNTSRIKKILGKAQTEDEHAQENSGVLHVPSKAFKNFCDPSKTLRTTPLVAETGEVRFVVGYRITKRNQNHLVIFDLQRDKESYYDLGEEIVERIKPLSQTEFISLHSKDRFNFENSSISLCQHSYKISPSKKSSLTLSNTGTKALESIPKDPETVQLLFGLTETNYRPSNKILDEIEETGRKLKHAVLLGPSTYIYPHINGKELCIQPIDNPSQVINYEAQSIAIPHGRKLQDIKVYPEKHSIFVTYKNITNNTDEVWVYTLKKKEETKLITRTDENTSIRIPDIND